MVYSQKAWNLKISSKLPQKIRTAAERKEMVVAEQAEPQSADNKTSENKASRFIPRALVGTFRAETGYDHGDTVPTAKPNWVVFGFASAIILAIALYTFLATVSA